SDVNNERTNIIVTSRSVVNLRRLECTSTWYSCVKNNSRFHEDVVLTNSRQSLFEVGTWQKESAQAWPQVARHKAECGGVIDGGAGSLSRAWRNFVRDTVHHGEVQLHAAVGSEGSRPRYARQRPFVAHLFLVSPRNNGALCAVTTGRNQRLRSALFARSASIALSTLALPANHNTDAAMYAAAAKPYAC
ncbi:hypothetical protein ACJJTC_018215, partial [Scirpophaga incertulas]